MTKQPKIAIVVQRCAENIPAGAEVYALKLAKALSESNASVDILTSQSDDYIHWNNNLSNKEILSPNLIIKRFRVMHGRYRLLFALVKRIAFFLQKNLNPVYILLSSLIDWIFLKTQGPWCPELWEYLKKNAKKYDLIVVKSYLYAPNVYSILRCSNQTKILFIVTAHDEPEFKLNFVRKCIHKTAYLGFVSLAEKDLCHKIWPISKEKHFLIVPPGLDDRNQIKICSNAPSSTVQNILEKKFFLSLGRIDKNKNIPFLFTHTPSDCLVVFAGEKHLEIPNDPRFVYLGKVTDSEKFLLLKNTLSLLMVSRLEAYSIVTAEALSMGCLVLALQGCGPVDELIARYGGLTVLEHEFSNTMQKLWQGNMDLSKYQPKTELIATEKSWYASSRKILELL